MRTTRNVAIHSTDSKIGFSIRVYDEIGQRSSVIHNQLIDTARIHSPDWQILCTNTRVNQELTVCWSVITNVNISWMMDLKVLQENTKYPIIRVICLVISMTITVTWNNKHITSQKRFLFKHVRHVGSHTATYLSLDNRPHLRYGAARTKWVEVYTKFLRMSKKNNIHLVLLLTYIRRWK